jgi:NAD(P)-dependent dehydrogenase (short-subunit alcohol dehydrogenase family)
MSGRRGILVTGGGTGVGRTVAAAFADLDFRVVIAGRRRSVLDAAASTIEGDVVPTPMDVRQPDDVARAMAEVVGRFGTIDVLVNNAAVIRRISLHTPLAEASRTWDDVVDTGLKGAFFSQWQPRDT